MNLRAACIFIVSVLAIAHGFPKKIKTVKGSHHDTQDKLTMYNGKNTTIEAHPYLVSILYQQEFQCTGSILSDNWCITTSDCIPWNADPEGITVMAGSTDSTTGDSFSVYQVVKHPQNGTDLSYEYALIQISGMFQWGAKVRAVKLPTSKIPDYTRGMVAGYGLSGDDETTRHLQQGGMRWFPEAICNETFTNAGYGWPERTGCLYSYNRTSLCGYDQGSPFTHNGTLYGLFIVPFPTGACTADAGPAVVADVFAVVSWIQQITGATYS